MPLNKLNENFSEIDKENYIGTIRLALSNSDNGWSNYADASAINPVDGLGGTPGTTLTQNTSSPLSGLVDFRFTKDASNRQGEGFSYGFSTVNRHLAKILQITFDVELISGTYSNGDLRVSIIQDPTGTPVLIEPVNTNIQLGTVNQRIKHIATFQSHISITSYRLCIHVSSTSTSAYTVDFNNFRVWETTQSIGSIITDWISYTPSTTRANTTNRSFYYRRSGGNIQISFGWQYTSGVIGSSTALLSDIFPPGLTLDLTKIAPANGSGSYLRYNIGHYFANDFGVNNNVGAIAWDTNQDPDQIAFFGSAPNGADDNLSGMIECPIQGWGSSVAMSNDSGDSRMVSAIYTNHGTTTTTGGTNGLRYSTLLEDTHSIYNTSNGAITIPISGTYQIKCSALNSSGTNSMYLYRSRGGGAITKIMFMGICGVNGDYFEAQLNCLSGDVLYASANSTVTFTPSALAETYISISRISAGSQIISTTETVACEVWTNTNSTGSTTANFIFNQVNRDTHNAWNISTGIYTAPMSGWYSLTVMINPNAGAALTVDLYKASVGSSFAKYKAMNYHTSIAYPTSSSGNFYLLAGEQISVRPSGSYTAFGTTTLAANSSWLSINRIGI
jgi:hypothetical protein